MLPPNNKKGAERPKLRKKDPDESSTRNKTKLRKTNVHMTCSRCGQKGHNRKTCKSTPKGQQPNTQAIQLNKVKILEPQSGNFFLAKLQNWSLTLSPIIDLVPL